MTDAKTWITTERVREIIDPYLAEWEAKGSDVAEAWKQLSIAKSLQHKALSRRFMSPLNPHPMPYFPDNLMPGSMRVAEICRKMGALCAASQDQRLLMSADEWQQLQRIKPENIAVEITLFLNETKGLLEHARMLDQQRDEEIEEKRQRQLAREKERAERAVVTQAGQEKEDANVAAIIIGAIVAAFIIGIIIYISGGAHP